MVISDDRLDRLEGHVRCIKAILARIEATVIHIDLLLAPGAAAADHAESHQSSSPAHLAVVSEIASVRSDLAKKPGKTFLAVTIAAYAAGLAAITVCVMAYP